MPDLKVVIPMAGIGKRMEPLTLRTPKALVRLADGRILDHVLGTFQALEKTYSLEYIFIIGHLGAQIKEHMRQAHPEKRVRYYVQERYLGQSHAVHLAQEAISGPVFLTYCDTINESDFSFLPLHSMDAVASVQEVEDPRRHGVAATGPGNLITKLIEKPETLEHRSALTGFYYFSEGGELIKAIETQLRTHASLHNEYYLADAINILLQHGMRIGAVNALQWHDAGTPEAILDTNAYLLRRRPEFHNGDSRGPSNILIPPVYIHEGSRVENSIIGPNVAIGENCAIHGSTLRNAIVDDNCTITKVTLVDSLVGKGCYVGGHPVRWIVGDYGGIRIYCSTDEASNAGRLQDS
jgi:glucose-1-phosphate thymidylyltransferase